MLARNEMFSLLTIRHPGRVLFESWKVWLHNSVGWCFSWFVCQILKRKKSHLPWSERVLNAVALKHLCLKHHAATCECEYKSALDKIRILELGQLSFYVLFKCLTLPWCSLCSEPSLLEFESVLYSAIVCGISENGEWNSPLVLAPQRKDVKCILRFYVLSKRLCGVTWCQVSLDVNGVGAAEGLVSTAGWTLHVGPLMSQSIFIRHICDESPLYCKNSPCLHF